MTSAWVDCMLAKRSHLTNSSARSTPCTWSKLDRHFPSGVLLLQILYRGVPRSLTCNNNNIINKKKEVQTQKVWGTTREKSWWYVCVRQKFSHMEQMGCVVCILFLRNGAQMQQLYSAPKHRKPQRDKNHPFSASWIFIFITMWFISGVMGGRKKGSLLSWKLPRKEKKSGIHVYDRTLYKFEESGKFN